MMRAPDFWYRPPGIWSRLLAPLGWLYAKGTARRLAKGPRETVGVPIVCIGNLSVGGTGKTPTVIALAERLMQQGIKPHVVTRGYGGALDGPVLVNERAHTAAEVGDEPLLMAAFVPVWKATDRAAGAKAAAAAGAQIILLDDGFQNPALQYDLSIVVVDAHQRFGNNAVLPAGPLREPVTAGLARADFVLVIGAAEQRHDLNVQGCTLLEAELKPLQTGMDWQDLPVFAFAGIGQPEKFFRTLKALGANLRGTVALADHQPLTQALLTRLGQQAAALSAQPVTTEKDAVRLPPALRGTVLTVPVRLDMVDWEPLDARLKALL